MISNVPGIVAKTQTQRAIVVVATRIRFQESADNRVFEFEIQTYPSSIRPRKRDERDEKVKYSSFSSVSVL